MPTAPPPDLQRTSLFLDFDGTLVDLAPHPDAVVVGPALTGRLARLAAALPGRVAIVSGRSIAQLDAILGASAAGMIVAGSHGAERRYPGGGIVAPTATAALATASSMLEDAASTLGIVFERKTLGAALHYRARPEVEAEAITAASRVAADHGLTLQHGKMMVEVRAPGSKGDAVRALLAEPATAGTRPLFFGDDVTDEDGFEAARDAGGAGVLIGAARATAARWRLADPAALGDWLDAALAMIEETA